MGGLGGRVHGAVGAEFSVFGRCAAAEVAG